MRHRLRRLLSRDRLIGGLRAALVVAWLVAAVVTHLPAPSGTPDPASREAVRGVWSSAGALARSLGTLVPDSIVELAAPLLSDKTVHFGISVTLAGLWCAIAALRGVLDRRRALVVVAVVTAYGAFGEWLQGFLGRYADPGDLLANALGAIAGAGLVYLARRRVAPAHVAMASAAE